MRRYYACTFKPNSRAFTYHHDGDQPFAPGDRVKVPAARGEGWSVVTVEGVSTEAPKFPTKAIIGAVEEAPEPADQAQAAAAVAEAGDLFRSVDTQ